MSDYMDVKKIPYLNIDALTDVNATFIEKYWGKKVNMIAVFKHADSGNLFKLNVYKNFKENKYGSKKDFRDIPFNTLLMLKLEPKTSKKTKQVYTRLLDYEILQTPNEDGVTDD